MLADLRYALRQLARSPGFTVVAVLTLALGAGTNSLLLSVIHAVLHRPLNYPVPDRIVSIALVPRGKTLVRMDAQATDWAYFEWRDESRSFAELAAYRTTGAFLAEGIAREVVSGSEVTPRFFPLLGFQPVLGRSFKPVEHAPTGPLAMLQCDVLWKKRVGSAPDLAGARLGVEARPV